MGGQAVGVGSNAITFQQDAQYGGTGGAYSAMPAISFTPDSSVTITGSSLT